MLNLCTEWTGHSQHPQHPQHPTPTGTETPTPTPPTHRHAGTTVALLGPFPGGEGEEMLERTWRDTKVDSDTRREDKYEGSPTETDESSVLVLCKNKTMSHFSEKVLSVQGRVVVTSDVHSCLEIMTQAVMQKVNTPSAWLHFFLFFLEWNAAFLPRYRRNKW